MKLARILRLLAIRRAKPVQRYYPDQIEAHLRELGMSPWAPEALQNERKMRSVVTMLRRPVERVPLIVPPSVLEDARAFAPGMWIEAAPMLPTR